MALNSIPAIFRKEMLDMLRDRRTLISMILVPIGAIPLLFFVMGKMMGAAEKRSGEEAALICVRSHERLPGLLNSMAGAGFKFAEKADLKAAIERKEIAAAVEPVRLPSGAIEVRIYSDNSRPGSELAASRIRTALDRFKEEQVKLKLLDLGVPSGILNPFSVKRENVAGQKKLAGMLWGGMLGYVVVLLMFSGGMYPAIDLTAGEKERRTLEVLLASPAGRHEIIIGKVLATTAAVAATAVLSVGSLVLSFRYGNFGKAGSKLGQMVRDMPLDMTAVGLTVVVLLPTAVMAASLMIAIALFAKSFKEAQSYLTPLILAVVFPLVIGFLPGIQLTPALALFPLFNTCQIVKEIFQGDFSRTALAVTLAANVAYAVIAFLAAVRVFGKESVLFRT